MIEQLTILANRLDAFNLVSEADKLDEISSRLVSLAKKSNLLTKEASSSFEPVSKGYLSAALDIYCIASSLKDKSLLKEATEVANEIVKTAYVGTILQGLGDLALSPFRGLWERGQYIQMQQSMTSIMNSLQTTLKSVDKNNEEASQNALQEISRKAETIKNQFSEYAAKARKNPSLFYMSRAVALAIFEWENKIGNFPSPYEAIRGLYMILFQVWQNIKSQLEVSESQSATDSAAPGGSGGSGVDSSVSIGAPAGMTGGGGGSSGKAPSPSAPVDLLGGKFNLNSALDVAHSIRNHAYVASMFKTVVSLFAKQHGFDNWTQVPDDTKKQLWKETKRYWEQKEKRPWNSLAHLRGRYDNQSLKRMTDQLNKLEQRYGV